MIDSLFSIPITAERLPSPPGPAKEPPEGGDKLKEPNDIEPEAPGGAWIAHGVVGAARVHGYGETRLESLLACRRVMAEMLTEKED